MYGSERDGAATGPPGAPRLLDHLPDPELGVFTADQEVVGEEVEG